MSENGNRPLTAEETIQADERFCGPPGSIRYLGSARDLGIPEVPSLIPEPKKKAIVDKRIHEACQRATRRNANGNK